MAPGASYMGLPTCLPEIVVVLAYDRPPTRTHTQTTGAGVSGVFLVGFVRYAAAPEQSISPSIRFISNGTFHLILHHIISNDTTPTKYTLYHTIPNATINLIL